MAASSKRVQRAAVVTQSSSADVEEPLVLLRACAETHRVELTEPNVGGDDGAPDVDLAIALGGDGTMLAALRQFLGTTVPVVGINFGRIGFLTTIPGTDLAEGIARVFAGDFRVGELATIEADLDGVRHAAVNDIVATSSTPGRMISLGSALADEDLGETPCDGLICCTPCGSTAYNLSNGGPVMMRGLAAMAITYVAPHSLHARPLVVPSGLRLSIVNRTPEVMVAVLVDGHRVGELASGEKLAVDVGAKRALLALLPNVTFFSRYREVFLSDSSP
ncbi:MAG: NAD(+)/NADH kinase [Actinomycetia bacterium]|nr:NAD(+)/NADH kinase [Actinomycetes bacterium]